MIAIIDYGAGNIQSVSKALRFIGADTVVTRDPKAILGADGAILPGVGSFGDCMNSLKSFGTDKTINDFVSLGKPFLGICLGLQLLFDNSEESVGVDGLKLLRGTVRRIPNTAGLKVPHIGWNSLSFQHNSPLFRGLDDGAYVYFVHSFCGHAAQEEDVIARTQYGASIVAAVAHNGVFGCQFHPEKSGEVGLHILKNFGELNR